MQIPRHIVVGPHRYTVTATEMAADRASVESKEKLLGRCDPANLQIVIRPGLPDSVLAEAVLHEVLHAIADVTGISNRLSADQEEEFVREIAPMLLDVLRRNPKLVECLTA